MWCKRVWRCLWMLNATLRYRRDYSGGEAIWKIASVTRNTIKIHTAPSISRISVLSTSVCTDLPSLDSSLGWWLIPSIWGRVRESRTRSATATCRLALSDDPRPLLWHVSDTDQIIYEAEVYGQQTRYSCTGGDIVTQSWPAMSGYALSGQRDSTRIIYWLHRRGTNGWIISPQNSWIIRCITLWKAKGRREVSWRSDLLLPRCCDTSGWQVPDLWNATTKSNLHFDNQGWFEILRGARKWSHTSIAPVVVPLKAGMLTWSPCWAEDSLSYLRFPAFLLPWLFINAGLHELARVTITLWCVVSVWTDEARPFFSGWCDRSLALSLTLTVILRERTCVSMQVPLNVRDQEKLIR